MKYYILGRLGGSAPLISTVFKMMGYNSHYGFTTKPNDDDIAI